MLGRRRAVGALQQRALLRCRSPDRRRSASPNPVTCYLSGMEEWQRDRIGTALRGENPTVMARLRASFAVIGDVQFLPGYSVAITDRPGADRLTDLPRADRMRFLADMEALGEAVERACRAHDPQFRRVNLEILGNTDPFLHAHVWPRYSWEPEEILSRPVWIYPQERWSDPESRLGPQHQQLRDDITALLPTTESN